MIWHISDNSWEGLTLFPGSSEYLHYYGSIDVYSANLADFAVCLLISKHKERNLWYIAPFPFYNINTNASLISLYTCTYNTQIVTPSPIFSLSPDARWLCRLEHNLFTSGLLASSHIALSVSIVNELLMTTGQELLLPILIKPLTAYLL